MATNRSRIAWSAVDLHQGSGAVEAGTALCVPPARIDRHNRVRDESRSLHPALKPLQKFRSQAIVECLAYDLLLPGLSRRISAGEDCLSDVPIGN
jgi:hypothetical protein